MCVCVCVCVSACVQARVHVCVNSVFCKNCINTVMSGFYVMSLWLFLKLFCSCIMYVYIHDMILIDDVHSKTSDAVCTLMPRYGHAPLHICAHAGIHARACTHLLH